MATSRVALANMTGADIRSFEADIIAAVHNGGELPAELADVFTLTLIEVADGIRGILTWA